VLLTVSTTMRPATDLGYLLHKHPDRAQRFETAAGMAHVFYPEATEVRATAALLLDIDPVGLVRGGGRGKGSRRGSGTQAGADAGAQYVDDRPYAASSLLAVAMAAVFSTAMAGICKARPELAETAIPLEIHIPALPCRGGGAGLVERLFGPLGWAVRAESVPLDEQFPEWGVAAHHDVTLAGMARLADALTQVYVLLPVLDDGKHYFVGRDEVDKLVREGARWLPEHPERHLIARRYLAHRGSLATSALSRLAAADDLPDDRLASAFEPGLVAPEDDPADLSEERSEEQSAADVEPEPEPEPEPALGPAPGRTGEAGTPSLGRLRREAIVEVLRAVGAARVADLGCGDGKLVAALLADPAFTEVVAADVSHRALELTARRLHLDRMPERTRARLRLIASSLTYRDTRLAGLDAAVLSEVVEHVDPPRLPALAEVVLGQARPRFVVVTTPNVEYNVRYPGLPPGSLRHRDHRFEWTRAEFAAWVDGLVAAYPYTARLGTVGQADAQVGAPTQLVVLERSEVMAA